MMDQFKKLLKLVRIGKLMWQAIRQLQICSYHAQLIFAVYWSQLNWLNIYCKPKKKQKETDTGTKNKYLVTFEEYVTGKKHQLEPT